jgi:hypothetical protein
MKLKNTTAARTALIMYAVGWIFALPSGLQETATHDAAFAIGYWGACLFLAGATLWGWIQLSSLRKQAREFVERLEPRVESVGSREQFAASLR